MTAHPPWCRAPCPECGKPRACWRDAEDIYTALERGDLGTADALSGKYCWKRTLDTDEHALPVELTGGPLA